MKQQEEPADWRDTLLYWGETLVYWGECGWDWVAYAATVVYWWIRLQWATLRCLPRAIRRAVRERMCWLLGHAWETHEGIRKDGSDDEGCRACCVWKSRL